MTVQDHITQTFKDFGVTLSEAAVSGIILRNGLGADAEVNTENITSVDRAVVKFVPRLLLTPAAFTEGSLSIIRAKKDEITTWYSMMCKELGIKDMLTKRSKVTFL